MDSKLSEILKTKKYEPRHLVPLQTTPLDAAVLVLLLPDSAGVESLLFTKRSEQVAHHKGQICFPGGVVDEGDPSLWHTALRETKEEIGIDSEHISFIGELGKVTTPTGFRVTPFVGRITQKVEYQPSPDEIAEVFTVPITHLLEPKNFSFKERTSLGKNYMSPVFTFETHQIWGATGIILLDVLEAWKSTENLAKK